MNDKGKLWRHVFKALQVLNYLLIHGSPYVVQYSIENIYIVKTLREFQHIDESGYDQGANVRRSAKELTILLSDRSKIEEARKKESRNNSGYGDSMNGYNRGYASSSSRIPYNGGNNNSSSRIERRGGHGRSESLAGSSNRYGDDDSEMRRAIAESKRSESSKKIPKDYDEDAALRKAIEASAREAKEKEDGERQRSKGDLAAFKGTTSAPAGGEIDLLGSFDDDFGAGPSSVNNIGMMPGSTNSFSQQQQQQPQQQTMMGMGMGMADNNMMFGGNQMGGTGNGNFDPFGLNNAGANNGFNAFGTNNGGMDMGMANYNTNMFDTSSAFNPNGNSQMVSQKFMSTTTITETSSGTPNPFGQTSTMPSASTNNLFDTGMGGGMNMMGSGGASTGYGGSTGGDFGGTSGAFGSAFDGGMAAKALPYGANPNDPNSKLAEIARNSEKIDPFASLALESSASSTVGGGGGNPFSGAASSVGNVPSQAPPPPAVFKNIAGVSSAALITPSSYMKGTGNSAAPAASSLNTGGLGAGGLVDLSPSALASSSTQGSSFGQVNRNPFASGASGSGSAMMGSGALQPSLNQLMSGAGAGSSMMSPANMFGQQQQNPNAMGGGGYSGMQTQPQQSMMYQNTQQPQQQQQQLNPFAQSTNTTGMNTHQTDLFGL
ncbi:hypothetical protein EV175_004093 [Coemansia sp. RSA 1933]|nr:hypothetical protein EV175_004093 [Coemansia sp. RSA 1933]